MNADAGKAVAGLESSAAGRRQEQVEDRGVVEATSVK